MEVVGGAASILTLIKGASVVARSTNEVARRLKDAPEELHTLTAQFLTLQSELNLVNHSREPGQDEVLPADLKDCIESAVLRARDNINVLDAISTRAQGNKKLHARLRWARKDRKLANDALGRLREVRASLTFLLQILSS